MGLMNSASLGGCGGVGAAQDAPDDVASQTMAAAEAIGFKGALPT
jgi:hypothetical protein